MPSGSLLNCNRMCIVIWKVSFSLSLLLAHRNIYSLSYDQTVHRMRSHNGMQMAFIITDLSLVYSKFNSVRVLHVSKGLFIIYLACASNFHKFSYLQNAWIDYSPGVQSSIHLWFSAISSWLLQKRPRILRNSVCQQLWNCSCRKQNSLEHKII